MDNGSGFGWSEARRAEKLQGEWSLEGTGEGMGDGIGVPAGLLRLDPAADTEADFVVDEEIPVDAARALR